MDAKICIEIQNTLGRFMQLYHMDRSPDALRLFASDGALRLPDRGIEARGREELARSLEELSAVRAAKGYRRDWNVAVMPAFAMAEDGITAMGKWDVHSFDFAATKDGSDKVEYIYGRIDASFREEEGAWRIADLDWWEFQSFVPWDYRREEDDGIDYSEVRSCEPPAEAGLTSASDFYAIQSVLTRYALNDRRYAMEDTFSCREDISLRVAPLLPRAEGRQAVAEAIGQLDRLEKDNIGKYVFVPGISCPVIEVSPDGLTAEGQWMASFFTFEGEAFGISSLPYRFVRRAGFVRADLVRENGQWRALHLDFLPFFRCPALDYDSWCQLENTGNGKFYQRMGLSENRWKPALPKMAGDFPQELPFLDSFIGTWANKYRRGDYMDFFEEHAFNDEWETIFHSRGRGRCSPPVVGTEEIRRFFGRGAFGYHHQQLTNHAAMSTDIQISADGRYATVCAFDFDTTPYDPGNGNRGTIDLAADWNQENSGFEHTPARFQLAMYQFHIVKVQGEWKLHKVEWEQLGDVNDQQLAGRASRGWEGSMSRQKFPALFEKYLYCPDRKLPGFRW